MVDLFRRAGPVPAEYPQQIRYGKTACRIAGHLLVETRPAEPAPGCPASCSLLCLRNLSGVVYGIRRARMGGCRRWTVRSIDNPTAGAGTANRSLLSGKTPFAGASGIQLSALGDQPARLDSMALSRYSLCDIPRPVDVAPSLARAAGCILILRGNAL